MKGKWIALSGNLGSVLSMLKLPDKIKNGCTVKPFMLDDHTGKNIPEDILDQILKQDLRSRLNLVSVKETIISICFSSCQQILFSRE